MMQPPYRTPQEHIDKIREEKFGLLRDGTIRSNPLSDDLQRAIRHLSEGLYSKETHFILELIQNAEDNRYSENVKPDLAFILLSDDPTRTPEAEGALVVVNNETGFRPEDVEALCAIGKTTKKKREGYIGEKGIGFKSVFVVSARPHIFSGGYQFRFQEEPDLLVELGYIVPYWVPEIPHEVRDYIGKTCVVLPLKPGKREEVIKELKSIAPETILFLSKLQRLTIRIEGEEPLEVMRDDAHRPLVQLLVGDQCSELWVVEQAVPVPCDLYEEKREGVSSRKIRVALPLRRKGDFEERVFAFLPTKVRSGLPFLVNADFILSTSRESIQFDRPWNQWLRDCIAPVFVQAFETLLAHPEYKAQAYSYIPLEDDVQESFFLPAVEAIHDELSNRAVIWTFDGDDLVEPPRARLAPREFRKLVSPDRMPAQLLETPLVHPDIQAYPRQLRAVGVKNLSSREIIQCLRDESWLESQDVDWFVGLYKYLSNQLWATQDNLQGLKLLLLEDGTRSDVAEQLIYFPEGDIQEIKQLQAQRSSVLAVAFLNSRLYDLIRDDSELCRWLTDTFGVRKLTLDNYCLDLARRLNERREDISVADLVRWTRYIRDRYEDFDVMTRIAIKKALPLALADGRIIAPQRWFDERPLVMPERMDPEAGWQLVFPDSEDRVHMTVLSDDYLIDCDKKEIRKWQRFFQALGATATPYPQSVSGLFYGSPDLTGYEAQLFEEFRGRFDALYPRSRRWPDDESVRNYRPPRWLSDLRLGTSHLGRRELCKRGKALIHWLDVTLSEQYGRIPPSFNWAHYEGYYRTWQDYKLDSEIKQCLLDAPWFPSTQGLKKPCEVFLDRPELRELFGDSIPYALENPSAKVAEWLGLRQTATVNDLLEYLKELCSQPAAKVDRSVVRRIYEFLSTRWCPDLKDEFEECPLILVSEPEPRWVTAERAVWPDLSAVFGEAYVYLEAQYDRRLKEFFVEKVGVPEQLSPKLYARAWDQLAKARDVQADAVKAALEHIYPELLKIAQEDNPPSWWREFCSGAKVWTQSDRFKPATRVYVPDDGELKRLFAQKGVEFAWRPEQASFTDYAPLYRALGVRSLVESVEATAEMQEVTRGDGVRPLLTPAMKEAICFHLWNTDRSEYERARQSGVLEALLKTREQVVNSLSVTYWLNWTVVEVSESVAYWEQDRYLLYRVDTDSEGRLEIEMPAILARRLSGGRGSNSLEDFIGRVLGASSSKVEGIIRKKNWSLPDDELAWLREMLSQCFDGADSAGSDSEVRAGGVGGGGKERDTGSEEAPKTAGVREIMGGGSRRHTGRIRGAGVEEKGPAAGGRLHAMRTMEGGGSGGEERTGAVGEKGDERRSADDRGPRPRWRPRLHSYVEPSEGGREEPADDEGGGEQSEQNLVERLGIKVALAYERQHGREPEEQGHSYEGYDIISYEKASAPANSDRAQRAGVARIIEVKATKYAWDGWGIGLTAPEYRAAQKWGDKYYLYVVEHVSDDQAPMLYVFRDPSGKIASYRFDDKWRAMADETATVAALQPVDP